MLPTALTAVTSASSWAKLGAKCTALEHPDPRAGPLDLVLCGLLAADSRPLVCRRATSVPA